MTPETTKLRFHQELDRLQARLMEMAGMAEDLVDRAIRAFLARDPRAIQEIQEEDRIIDALEIQVDEQVVQLIALYQPVARDLRQILTNQKICNDVERVGDHAVNISKAAGRLAALPPLPDIPEIRELAVLSQRMLRDALSAFVARDSKLAREVCTRDDRVDEMRSAVNRLLLDLMAEDSRRMGPALESLRASQQLERIGDLSTNISEDVVFLVEGRSIKHNAERRLGEADSPS